MKKRNWTSGDDWKTPDWLYQKLNAYYRFDFDPCPFMHDTSLWDGLEVEWGQCNFVNPPYSRALKEAFILKGVEEYKKGKQCVFLLPVSTSTKIFHEVIMPNAFKIDFLRGRIKFAGYNSKMEWVDNKAGMHDSMVVVF